VTLDDLFAWNQIGPLMVSLGQTIESILPYSWCVRITKLPLCLNKVAWPLLVRPCSLRALKQFIRSFPSKIWALQELVIADIILSEAHLSRLLLPEPVIIIK
jgi:hypothetical protein